MAELNQFKLEVISPERIFYEGDVEMVELTTTEGDIGILAGHISSDMVGVGYAHIRCRMGGDVGDNIVVYRSVVGVELHIHRYRWVQRLKIGYRFPIYICLRAVGVVLRPE